jgi:hypothetical protein
MNRLILLAGLHKTGTTSIQRTFRKHVAAVHDKGFTYPLLTFKDRNADAFPENHSKLIGGMFARKVGPSKSENAFRGILRRTFGQFLQAHQAGNMIMAAEQLSTMTVEDLAELKDWFEHRGFRIELFCSVRKVQSWLTSMVAQRVIGLRGPRLTLEQAIREFEVAGGIVKPRIEKLADVFANARFFSFERSIRHPRGPFGNFLDLVGIGGLEHIEPVLANEGKSDHAVRLNSLVNATLGSRGDNKEANVRMFRGYPALQSIPGDKFRLREREIANLLPLIVSESEWLRSKYGDDFGDDRISFSNDPTAIDATTRALLTANLADAEPWLRAIVEQYLVASHCI